MCYSAEFSRIVITNYYLLIIAGYVSAAYAAPVAHAAYAAPIAHTAYAAPVVARTYAAPAVAAPAHGLLGVAYSAAPAVSHMTYSNGLGIAYGW